jgi:hypothetical protein
VWLLAGVSAEGVVIGRCVSRGRDHFTVGGSVVGVFTVVGVSVVGVVVTGTLVGVSAEDVVIGRCVSSGCGHW